MSIYAHRANDDGDMEVVEIHDSGELDLEEGEERCMSGSSTSGKGHHPTDSLESRRAAEDGQILDEDFQRDVENRTKLIVNYLPQSLRDEELAAIFGRIGLVKSVKIIRDSATLYSYGYGFVEFEKPEDAETAVKQLKGFPIQNKRLGVSFARTHDRESLKNTNLYVANLPSTHCSESSVRELFAPYGKIITLKLLRDERSGNSRGTAFVRFDRKQEAENAIKNLNGTRLPGAYEGLIVRVSEEHGKQKVGYFGAWSPPGSASSASTSSSSHYGHQYHPHQHPHQHPHPQHHHHYHSTHAPPPHYPPPPPAAAVHSHHHRADPSSGYPGAGYTAYSRPRGHGMKSRAGGRVVVVGGPRFGRWNGGSVTRGSDRRPYRGGAMPPFWVAKEWNKWN